ncbi:MAG TPA: DinB family protein [Thermoanaerobaculia bacterium]|nr:DinB family protein [Thermoanaerobaculia bacterium]
MTAIEGEFQRHKSLADRAIAQLADGELGRRLASANSVATLVQHVGGNLKSRFTEFLTSDGEKPWRDREAEFADGGIARSELVEKWEDGWRALFAALQDLTDDHLSAAVSIRGVQLSVVEALARSLAHTSYHVGQIVFMARHIRGPEWRYLSIAPGQTAAYNAAPDKEKPAR